MSIYPPPSTRTTTDDSNSIAANNNENNNSDNTNSSNNNDQAMPNGATTSTTPATRTPAFRLVLQPRSLLVFKDELYSNYLHGIEFAEQDVLDETVINLAQACERECGVM